MIKIKRYSRELILFTFIFVFNSYAFSHSSPNFLLIIADDLGVDTLGVYNPEGVTASTPNLDKLAKSGVLFENFWVTPACTTTRGALISGQHGFESSIDYVPAVMPDSTYTIQQRLKEKDIGEPYTTGVFGKWHLGGRNPELNHPAKFGIDQYAGNLFNLENYNDWIMTQNGKQSRQMAYHTSKITDLALDFIQKNQGKPWFTWLAYSAPHTPFHTPPDSLVKSIGYVQRPADKYRLMVEAMDSEIGRLLDSIPKADKEHTIVIFIGDNGTPKRARDRSLFAKDHVKGSLYEGGIRTPLIVSGNPISRVGVRETTLVNATDVFATLVDFASNAHTGSLSHIPLNSFSFRYALDGSEAASKRRYNYSEWKKKNILSWAIKSENFKLLYRSDGDYELFDSNDLRESKPLDNPQKARELIEIGKVLRGGEGVAGTKNSINNKKIINSTSTINACASVAGHYQHTGMDNATHHTQQGSITIDIKESRCAINANGIPDHNYNLEEGGFRHDVSAQSYQFYVPLMPKKSHKITPLSLRTDNGILLNGVKIDLLAAACYGVGDEKIGCNNPEQAWRFDPAHMANGFRMDEYIAHTQPNGAYHYHGTHKLPHGTEIIGFAADGFPIRTPYIIKQGKLIKLKSSYRLKTGKRQPATNLMEAKFPGGNYDGTFRDDWEYVKGLGDLDICNGGDFGNGYSYYATESFPYFMACFIGTPDPSFNKSAPMRRSNR